MKSHLWFPPGVCNSSVIFRASPALGVLTFLWCEVGNGSCRSSVRRCPSPPRLSLSLAENEPFVDMGVYFYASLSGVGSFLGFELHSTSRLPVPRPAPLCFGDCSSVCDSEAHCCTPKRLQTSSKVEHGWAFQAGEMGRLRGCWQDREEKTWVGAVGADRDCKADRPRIPHTL